MQNHQGGHSTNGYQGDQTNSASRASHSGGWGHINGSQNTSNQAPRPQNYSNHPLPQNNSNRPINSQNASHSQTGTGQAEVRQLQGQNVKAFPNLTNKKRSLSQTDEEDPYLRPPDNKRICSPVNDPEDEMDISKLVCTLNVADLETPGDFVEPRPGTLNVKVKDHNYLKESAVNACSVGMLIRSNLNYERVCFGQCALADSLSCQNSDFWDFTKDYKLLNDWNPPDWRGDSYTGHILCRCTLEVLQSFLSWFGIANAEVCLLDMVDKSNVSINPGDADAQDIVIGICFNNPLAFLKFGWFGAKLITTSDPVFRMIGLPFWDNLWIAPKRANGAFHLFPSNIQEIQSFLKEHIKRFWHFTTGEHMKNLTFSKTPKAVSVAPMSVIFDKRIDRMEYAMVEKARLLAVEPLIFDKKFGIIKDYALKQKSTKSRAAFRQTAHDYVRTMISVFKESISCDWFKTSGRDFLLQYKHRVFKTAGLSEGNLVTVNEVALNPDYNKSESQVSSMKIRSKQDLLRLVGDGEARDILSRIISGDATFGDYDKFSKHHTKELETVKGKLAVFQQGLVSEAIVNRQQFAMSWQTLEGFAKSLQAVAAHCNLPDIAESCNAMGVSSANLRLAATNRVQDLTLGFLPTNAGTKVDEYLYQVDGQRTFPLALKGFNPQTQLNAIKQIDHGSCNRMHELVRNDPISGIIDNPIDSPSTALGAMMRQHLELKMDKESPKMSIGGGSGHNETSFDTLDDSPFGNPASPTAIQTATEMENDFQAALDDAMLEGSLTGSVADTEITFVIEDADDNALPQSRKATVKVADLDTVRKLPEGNGSMSKE
ncbi:unnamed protein product [Oikopleura dioica]|uniref:Uncharacterized protein n=1 Tax=Oikopleura dioica TaxID=34765 RepID=E4YRP8_OIKDI|nr:unnamed protein product [Oikopleura dioica]